VFGYHNTVELARNTDIGVGIVVALIACVSHSHVSPEASAIDGKRSSKILPF
jgi:hypothetical protein